MTGPTFRQEIELNMIGGGLESDVVLDGVWAVGVVAVFVVSNVSVVCSDVRKDRE